VNIGAVLVSSQRSVDVAQKHDSIYAVVGVHPHDARTLDDDVYRQIESLVGKPKVVAIGEIGLDYYRDLSPRPVQKRAFQRQLELAVRLKKPVVIHTREAFEDTLEIVGDYASRLPGGVFHCFPGSTDDAQRVFDLGFIISVGGVITYKNSRMAVVASEVPLEKIIIETDAPYLTPVPHRGKTNKPSYVKLVCDHLAVLRSMPVSEAEKITDRNCRKLFGMEEIFEG